MKTLYSLFLLISFTINAQTPHLVKDIVVGSQGSSPQYLTEHNGKLYFGAVFADGLWSSDGTEAGTVVVDNTIGADTAGSLYSYNGKLYFNTFSAPAWWSTTGGVNEATKIIDNLKIYSYQIYNSSVLGQELMILTGKQAAPLSSPILLYRSDGTELGTQSFGGFDSDSRGPIPHLLGTINSRLLLSAEEISTGRELYRSDATTVTTHLVKDNYLGDFGSIGGERGVFLNGIYYFPAFGNNPSGRKLWRTDGTSNGTVAIYNEVGVDTGTAVDYDDPINLTVFDNSVYFFANEGSPVRRQLWRVNELSQHPEQVTFDDVFIQTSNSFGCQSNLSTLEIGLKLYFSRESNGFGCELWMSNSQTQITSRISDINPDGLDSYPKMLGAFNGLLYFTALNKDLGFELWRSDGTSLGTTLVADINPGTQTSLFSYEMLQVGDNVFFVADDGVHGHELFTFDASSKVQFAMSEMTVDENAGTVDIHVSRNNSGIATSVDYATVDGTAMAGTDYLSATGTLTWDATDSSDKIITLGLVSDMVDESVEDFTIILSNPLSPTTLGTPDIITIQIVDDGVFRDGFELF